MPHPLPTLQRFTPHGNDPMLIVESRSGDYVRYTDVLPHLQRLQQLEDALDTTAATLRNIRRDFDSFITVLTDKQS